MRLNTLARKRRTLRRTVSTRGGGSCHRPSWRRGSRPLRTAWRRACADPRRSGRRIRHGTHGRGQCTRGTSRCTCCSADRRRGVAASRCSARRPGCTCGTRRSTSGASHEGPREPDERWRPCAPSVDGTVVVVRIRTIKIEKAPTYLKCALATNTFQNFAGSSLRMAITPLIRFSGVSDLNLSTSHSTVTCF